jgi:hypothetical protein
MYFFSIYDNILNGGNMNKIKKNRKMILNIMMILTFFIIMFNMKTYVLAVGEKIEIKDGGEIITQSEGNLTTPKVLNVNIMKEKKLTLNTIGLDKTKLEYNIEEKEGNLDFDVNIMTGEIRLKVKSGINAGVIFSIKDRGTNKVYPISLVIKAVDRKK